MASVFGTVLYLVALIYLILLMARMVLSWVVMLARDFKPAGAGLVAIEAIFTVTDPPIKLVRRVIKPIRVGPVAIDIAFMLVVLAVVVVMSIASAL